MEIRLENLQSSWGDFSLVADTVIPGGELVTLLGPSGAGKSTLLHLIAGFLRPDGGRIFAGGREITGLPPHKRKIGLVFQDYALFPHLSVKGNITFGSPRGRKAGGDYDSRLRELYRLLELEGMLDRKPFTLSGGEKQRTALGRALASGPDLLLLDEPFSALDPFLRGSLREELRAVQRSTGVTTLLVTHDQDEALSLSDRIILFNGGRIVETGTPDKLYRQPDNLFTARFLGEGNFVPVGTDEVLFFRPEDLIQVSNHGGTEARRGGGEREYKGIVGERMFYGGRTLIKVQTEDSGELLWQVSGSECPSGGQAVRLRLRDGAGRIIRVPADLPGLS
jgi:ABC-type Fe3+/spermidine/putrescine transport system ATPase subunit